jgi:hypothetical protein
MLALFSEYLSAVPVTSYWSISTWTVKSQTFNFKDGCNILTQYVFALNAWSGKNAGLCYTADQQVSW